MIIWARGRRARPAGAGSHHRSQLGQHRVPDGLDLAGGQQGAEEQVTVCGQALAQSCLVIKQGRGIGQLIHTPTVSSGR